MKESSYQLWDSVQFYLVIVKKSIVVQAQPNQYPAVLLFPDYCKQLWLTQAKAFWGSTSYLPSPHMHKGNNACL